MNRQQLRFQIRETTKSIKKAQKTREYKSMIHYFDKLPKEEYILLDKGEHTDPKKQLEFKRYMDDMKTFVGLQTKLEYLANMQKARLIPQGEQVLPPQPQSV